MPPSDPIPSDRSSPRPDWRAWAALAWVAVFGMLYARMMIRERAPGLWDRVREAIGVG